MAALGATISKVTTMADKTVRLQVDCQEMNSDDMTILFSLNGKLGHFFFREAFFTDVDNEKLPELKIDKGEKTPSQRLRSRLFVYYTEVTNGKKEDFNIWYDRELAKIGEKYLEMVK
jgi:hypothetical protein